MRILVCCSFVVLFLTPRPVAAWWEDGHVVIAKIAEAYLSESARAEIKDLLDGQSIADPRICTWADLIRSSGALNRKYPKNDSWHYINIDITTKERDFKPPPDGNHIVAAIKRFHTILADTTANKQDRKEALMFVVHFVGDMHQPLHCGFRDNDRGGNLQPVRSYDGKIEEKLNLHKIWDGHLVRSARGELTIDDFAKRLIAEIGDRDRQAWEKGDTMQWAWESHQIVVERVYHFADGKTLPKMNEAACELTPWNYIRANRSVIPAQFKKGGVRLAKILNECFKAKE